MIRQLSLILLLWATAAGAQSVPQTLNHQGRLFDNNSNPVSGTHSMVFSFYAAATGGSALWTETQSLAVDNSYYATALGSVTPFPASLFSGSVLYLGITVDTDLEMTPREPVGSVPYALVAGNAIGDISPHTVTVGGTQVIDPTGHWTGPSTGGAAYAWSGFGFPFQGVPQSDGSIAHLTFNSPQPGFALVTAHFGVRVRNDFGNTLVDCHVMSQLAATKLVPTDRTNCSNGGVCVPGYVDNWVNGNLPTQNGGNTYLTLENSTALIMPVVAGSNTVYLNGAITGCLFAYWGPITVTAVYVNSNPTSTFSIP